MRLFSKAVFIHAAQEKRGKTSMQTEEMLEELLKKAKVDNVTSARNYLIQEMRKIQFPHFVKLAENWGTKSMIWI